MSKKSSSAGSGSRAAVADELHVHARGFLATLPAMGYPRTSQHEKRRVVARFARWARRAEFVVADLDETRIGTFLARRRGKPRKMERATVYQFLGYLRAIGAVPPRRASEPSAGQLLLERYLEHLRGDRGLCRRSVEVYAPFARAFVDAQELPERIASLDASTIRAYLVDRSRNRSVSFVKLLAAALRSFLRFLFFDDVTQFDLSGAVPPVRRWRHAGIPPFLTPEQVERVIAATDRSTASGCRTHAMVLLLARLGLRRRGRRTRAR